MPAAPTPEATRSDARIAIIGLGLIGASIGLAVRRVRPHAEVHGYDCLLQNASTALDRGAVGRLSGTLAEAVRHADLVFVATPAATVIDVVRALAPLVSSDCIVTDVAGVKSAIVYPCVDILGERFVGGHPLAGSEQQGPAHADASLFDGAAWAITPGPNGRRAADAVAGVVREVGARPVITSPEEHDRVVALLSHLPHAFAFLLKRLRQEHVPADLAQLYGGSYRDATRVARSDHRRWAQIMSLNADHMRCALELAENRLREMRLALENVQDLESLLDPSAETSRGET